jgi:hypothetical protein
MLYLDSSHAGDDYFFYHKGEYRNVEYESVKHYTTITLFSFADAVTGFEYKFHRVPEDIIFYDKSFFIGSRIEFPAVNLPLFFEWEMEITGFRRVPNTGLKVGTYPSLLLNPMLPRNEARGRATP